MLRTAIGLLLALAATAPASAQDLPAASAMTCAQAQAFVQSRHAVVMKTGPTTFDRIVSEDILCRPDGYTAPQFARTLDKPECMIGYYCHEIEENDK